MQLLDQVRIAKPCPASWNEMEGDERTRYCKLCKLNVHNISEMTREEAEAFLRKSDGRICLRIYHREDGKVMTRDCPRGVAAVRRKFALAITTVFGASVAALSYAVARPIPKGKFEQLKKEVRQHEPIKTILDKIDPPPVYPPAILGSASIVHSPSAPISFDSQPTTARNVNSPRTG